MKKPSRLLIIILLGLGALIVAGILFVLLAPFLIAFLIAIFPWIGRLFLLFMAFMILWGILYIIAMLGTSLYYFFAKPAEVREQEEYSLEAIEEEGRRQKGKRKQ